MSAKQKGKSHMIDTRRTLRVTRFSTLNVIPPENVSPCRKFDNSNGFESIRVKFGPWLANGCAYLVRLMLYFARNLIEKSHFRNFKNKELKFENVSYFGTF